MKPFYLLVFALHFWTVFGYDCLGSTNSPLTFCSGVIKYAILSEPTFNLTVKDSQTWTLYNITTQRINDTNTVSGQQKTTCFSNIYKLLCTAAFPACQSDKLVKPCVQVCINTWTSCGLNSTQISGICGTRKEPNSAFDKGYCATGSSTLGLDGNLITLTIIISFLASGVGFVTVLIVSNISFCCFLCQIKKIQEMSTIQ